MKSLWKALAFSSAILISCTACMPAGTTPPDYSNMTLVQLTEPEDGTDMAVVNTNYGTFKFVLYDEYAPEAVENFKELVEAGFYDNNAIYAVANDSQIFTAGSSDSEGMNGVVMKDGVISDAEEDKLDMETSYDLWHFTGAVSIFGDTKGTMSSTVLGDSRFFVVGYSEPTSDMADELDDYNYPDEVIEAYKTVGGQPIYTGAYTVFGQIVEGYDVVTAIASAETEIEDGTSTEIPAEELVIDSIELTTYSSDTVNYESPEDYAKRRQEELDASDSSSDSAVDSLEEYYSSYFGSDNT